MTKIAIITVDFNGHQDTAELLASSRDLNTRNLEILRLVVDNGSAIPVEKTIHKFPGVTWLQTGKNLGFAGGFNRGIKYAQAWGANYFLLINNDALFGDQDILQKLLQVFSAHPRAGVISPKIYFAPGYEFFKDKYTASDRGRVIWYAGGSYDWNNIASVHRGIDCVDTGAYNRVEKTGFVSGCCVIFSRDLLDKVGFFEEKLFAYYEDADWVRRAELAGFDQWYAGDTFIYHKVSRTSGIGSEFTDYLTSRNRLWLGLKWGTFRTKFALVREAVRLLISGRPAQKEGIKDYFTGVWGWKKSLSPENPGYPLELSIVIVNYQSKSFTLQLLKSLRLDHSSQEIILVDNSPQENTVPDVRQRYPEIKTITNNVNTGFSFPNNQGINYSRGKYVLLLNSDVEVRPDSVKNLLTTVKKYGDRAIYTGKLSFADGSPQDSCYWLPTPWRAFEEYFLRRQGKYFMYRPPADKISRVEGAVMAVFLIPRPVINEIGMLEEETFIYFEDVEYCRRAKSAGIPVYFVPRAEFIHHHGQSSKAVGLNESNQRLITASKWYHGKIKYYILYWILWAGQKFGKVIAPQSRWKQSSSTP
jgi:GT2 family glycosyltransferase